MGKHVAGGGRKQVSARLASDTPSRNAYDIARNALRGMGNVRIATSSHSAVIIETTGSTAARSVARMREVESVLKNSMVRSPGRRTFWAKPLALGIRVQAQIKGVDYGQTRSWWGEAKDKC